MNQNNGAAGIFLFICFREFIQPSTRSQQLQAADRQYDTYDTDNVYVKYNTNNNYTDGSCQSAAEKNTHINLTQKSGSLSNPI